MRNKSNKGNTSDVELGAKQANGKVKSQQMLNQQQQQQLEQQQRHQLHQHQHQQQQQQYPLLVTNGDSSQASALGNLAKSHKPSSMPAGAGGKFPDLSRRHSRANDDDDDSNDNDDDSNDVSKFKMSHFFERRKCLLLLSMSIILTLAAVLVAILLVSLLDNHDQCYQNLPFQRPNYKLFATKTAYSAAQQRLDRQLKPTSNHYDTSDSDELPAIFARSEQLAQLHQWLTSAENNCKARQFHFFGRHAARFPSSKRIAELNQILADVQKRIDLSKYSLPSSSSATGSQNNQSAGSGSSSSSSNNNNNNNNSNNNAAADASNKPANSSSPTVCFNPLAQYKQWSSFMVPEQGNLVMDSGAREVAEVAARYKQIYPEMFDAKQANIHLGTTEQLRTAQTALEFVKQLDNFTLSFCQLNEFPQDNLSDRSKAADIADNSCLKSFLATFKRDELAFHKRCRSLAREEFLLPFHFHLRDPKRLESIALSASKKLRLSEDERLSAKETQALYRICTFDSAQFGSSIWCNLFSDEDLKFFEFMGDVDDFFNQAYGDSHQYRSACPLTTELMKAFRAARRLEPAGQPQSHFYFTHSEVIMKLLAASVDLESDPEYQRDTILRHLDAGTSPSRRQWRSSLFAPFSANLAFTLYECSKSPASPGRPPALAAAIAPNQAAGGGSGTGSGYIELDVGEKSLKVVASLNERPILLDGCSSHICDLGELTSDSRLDKEKRCRMEEICKRNYRLPDSEEDIAGQDERN